ncbi:MAG: Fe-S-containing hydro-lyase [Eubacteriaceae bacterium]|nr:Fe-S-containing hydro-lyase [Eubacteriaceae bacterium]
MKKQIILPISDEQIKGLNAGDIVSISGVIYTARDAAHKRMDVTLETGGELPFDVRNQGIYYLGPTPARPGRIIGSAGPTSSYRMDKYTPMLLDRGLKVMIGKGRRGQNVIESMKKNCAVYFAATGGAAALLSNSIKNCEVIAYGDLGTEAIRRLTLDHMDAIVAIDCYGVDQYEKGQDEYLSSL